MHGSHNRAFNSLWDDAALTLPMFHHNHVLRAPLDPAAAEQTRAKPWRGPGLCDKGAQLTISHEAVSR